jgi:hypothetical protein
MITPEPIPGFHAVEFKNEMQAILQAKLAGLSGAEKLRKIREIVENGPFADWWKRMQEAQAANRA